MERRKVTDQTVTLTVTLAEAVDIVNLLGSLPTKANAFPLYAKLVGQVQPLLPAPEPAPAEAV